MCQQLHSVLWKRIIPTIVTLALGIMLVQCGQTGSSASSSVVYAPSVQATDQLTPILAQTEPVEEGTASIAISVPNTQATDRLTPVFVQTEPITASNVPSTPTRGEVSARQAMADRDATDQAQPPPITKGPNYSPTPNPSNVLIPYHGIVNITQTMFPNNIIVENMWTGYVNGEGVTIQVGMSKKDPTLGMLIVVKGDFPEPRSSVQNYYTPIRAGSVHLIAADATGTQLTLQSQQGYLFVFDRTTGQFLNVPPSNYPTATPGTTLSSYPAPNP